VERTKIDEERISDIHFQLTNVDRRKIIEELQTQNLKLNEVAKKLDITATEACRQLQRLTDAGLLEKSSDGRFRSTPYSRLILESSATMDFLSKHKEYFLDHDASLIPSQFRVRFGELSKTVLRTEAVVNINTATKVLENADKQIAVMAEQHLEHNGQILGRQSLKGVKVRSIIQENMIETIEEEPVVKQSWERRSIPRICAILVVTEKIMGIALPKLDGKMDYQVFEGTDPESIRWARDLFEDQWNKTRPSHI
jgi:predicted transcriptional regulator